MKTEEIIEPLKLRLIAGKGGVGREVKSGYCGDLLSDVMANAPDGSIWITIQTHQNIVAVAVLRDMAGIIISADNEPDEETKKRAEAENIPILASSMTSFEIAGLLYELGIGKRENI